MSDQIPPVDLRAHLARIDRDLAEAEKLRVEQRKLNAESEKFVIEQHKLNAEAGKLASEDAKLRREWILAPLLAAVALIGGVLGAASFLARFVP